MEPKPCNVDGCICRSPAEAAERQLAAERLHWKQIHDGCHEERDLLTAQLAAVRTLADEFLQARDRIPSNAGGRASGLRSAYEQCASLLRRRLTLGAPPPVVPGDRLTKEQREQVDDAKRYCAGAPTQFAYGDSRVRLHDALAILDQYCPRVTPEGGDLVTQCPKPRGVRLTPAQRRLVDETIASFQGETGWTAYEPMERLQALLAILEEHCPRLGKATK